MPGELKRWPNAAITDMQMRQRDVAALDAKHTKELADAKAENDALRDDVAAGRRRLSKQSVDQYVKPPPPRVDNAASDWQTPLNGIISHPQRADPNSCGRSRSILMSSADRVAISMGNSCNEQYTRFQRIINA